MRVEGVLKPFESISTRSQQAQALTVCVTTPVDVFTFVERRPFHGSSEDTTKGSEKGRPEEVEAALLQFRCQ